MLEIQNYPIDAIPQTRRWRAVVKNVAQVRFAASAHDLRAIHAMAMIGRINDASIADRFVKAGPPTTTLELGVAPEQRIAAYGAIIGSDLFVFFQGTGIRPFRAFLPGYFIHILRKDLLPLLVGQIHGGIIVPGIGRVVGLVVGIHTV
jgi:hypothetical protein